MANLETMSARKLAEEIARRKAVWSARLDDTIAAGMGDMRHSDMVEYSKGSSLRSRVVTARNYIAATAALREAEAELDRRKQWHGSDKPIKRRA